MVVKVFQEFERQYCYWEAFHVLCSEVQGSSGNFVKYKGKLHSMDGIVLIPAGLSCLTDES